MGEDRSRRQPEGRPLLIATPTFGRRRSRRLSARRRTLVETLLPRLRAVPGGGARLWFEIGFGAGEHLAWQAERNPDVILIGAEVWKDGVANLLSRIDRQGLDNVRIVDGDARDALAALAPASLERIFVLFPDPWPKARHRKRRLVNAETARLFADLLADGGEIRLATDIADYARDMLLALGRRDELEWRARRPQDWRRRPADWPETRYEAKARREGRQPFFLSFVRRPR